MKAEKIKERKVNKELMGASSILLILSLLESENCYGYEIMSRVRKISNNFIRWKEGSIYPVLKKLEGRRMIMSNWDLKSNLRPRKYYSITAIGKKKLTESKEDWIKMNNVFEQLWKP